MFSRKGTKGRTKIRDEAGKRKEKDWTRSIPDAVSRAYHIIVTLLNSVRVKLLPSKEIPVKEGLLN